MPVCIHATDCKMITLQEFDACIMSNGSFAFSRSIWHATHRSLTSFDVRSDDGGTEYRDLGLSVHLAFNQSLLDHF